MAGLDWLTARPIAHRGLHDAASGVIENTASAVKRAIEGNFSVEVDLHVTADGEAKARGTYADADGGPSAIYWLDEGYGCAVVGTLPKDRLSEVARSAWRQLLAGARSS